MAGRYRIVKIQGYLINGKGGSEMERTVVREKKFFAKIETVRGATITWCNGGVGYSEEEFFNRVLPRLKSDKRIVSYNYWSEER